MIRIKYLTKRILFSIVLVLASFKDKELKFKDKSEPLAKSQRLFAEKSSNGSTTELDDLLSMLPSQVIVTMTSEPDDDAYFNLTIDDSTGFLSSAEIPAWCANQNLGLDNNEIASFDVYSSYGELPEGRFENPENFDKVNYYW